MLIIGSSGPLTERGHLRCQSPAPLRNPWEACGLRIRASAFHEVLGEEHNPEGLVPAPTSHPSSKTLQMTCRSFSLRCRTSRSSLNVSVFLADPPHPTFAAEPVNLAISGIFHPLLPSSTHLSPLPAPTGVCQPRHPTCQLS